MACGCKYIAGVSQDLMFRHIIVHENIIFRPLPLANAPSGILQ